MYQWILLFFAPWAAADAKPAATQDYIGVAAAEAAYASLLPERSDPEPAPQPPDPNCPKCHGTGKVPSGDGQGVTKCPVCQASAEKPVAAPAPAPAPAPAAPKAVAPKPTSGWPPAPVRTVPPATSCIDGNCPPTVPVKTAAPVQVQQSSPVYVLPGRVFRRG